MKRRADSAFAGDERPHSARLLPPEGADPGAALGHYLEELLAPGTAAAPAREPLLHCRLFAAAGIVLAAPASALGPVPSMPLRAPAARVPHWIAGWGEHRGERLLVVDLAALIGEPPSRGPGQDPAGVWLRLVGTNVALRAQRLLSTADLDPARICWRTAHTSRAWLMGVCEDPPCALLDVAALVAAATAAAAGMDCAI